MGGLGELAAVGTVRPCQGGGGSPELEKMAAVRGMGRGRPPQAQGIGVGKP